MEAIPCASTSAEACLPTLANEEVGASCHESILTGLKRHGRLVVQLVAGPAEQPAANIARIHFAEQPEEVCPGGLVSVCMCEWQTKWLPA